LTISSSALLPVFIVCVLSLVSPPYQYGGFQFFVSHLTSPPSYLPFFIFLWSIILCSPWKAFILPVLKSLESCERRLVPSDLPLALAWRCLCQLLGHIPPAFSLRNFPISGDVARHSFYSCRFRSSTDERFGARYCSHYVSLFYHGIPIISRFAPSCGRSSRL